MEPPDAKKCFSRIAHIFAYLRGWNNHIHFFELQTLGELMGKN